jgi:hypothetical protein
MFKKKVRQKRTPVVAELPDVLILEHGGMERTNNGCQAHERVNSDTRLTGHWGSGWFHFSGNGVSQDVAYFDGHNFDFLASTQN